MIHRLKIPGISDPISWEEITGPCQCRDPKSEVDKNGGESFANILGDAWCTMNGSRVWDAFWWTLML
jgi:hypothetical protein